MKLSASVEIPLPKERVFPFFCGLETWFRLNPEWQVLSVEPTRYVKGGDRFSLKVRYDRGDKPVDYEGVVEEFIEGDILSVRLNAAEPRHVTMYCADKGGRSLLRQEEVIENGLSETEHRELDRWLKSVAWYVMLQNTNTATSKAWKFFMDRVWLRMSPAGRRIVLLVLIAEGAGFIFFLLFIVIHYAAA